MKHTVDQTVTYWPDWIENSASLLAVVFDSSGQVCRVNRAYQNKLTNVSDKIALKVAALTNLHGIIKANDFFESKSNETAREVTLWVEYDHTCVNMGCGWEVTPREIAGEEMVLVAIRPLVYRCEYPRQTKESRSIHSRIPGLFFNFLQTDTGHQSLPHISEGIVKWLKMDAALLRDDAEPVMERIHREDQSIVADSIRQSAGNMQRWEATFRFVCSKGDIRWVQGVATPELQFGAILWRGVLFDVTDKVNYKQQLLDQQRELEEIAFVQAHEFRRPLANMLGLLDLIEMKTKGRSFEMEEIVELLSMLNLSAKEVDEVIARIVTKTSQIRNLVK
ncbi:PAS fold-containing protein [Reichenbachiella agariperforans]|uniref:PAS fold-containing protein n=1 Tax=Reichenbachiella agariperforans TaxID=156994 RepID=A0A1M6T137_REIAG|nr:PAS domain-containing protein [Reichenbachiella agariperforans]SHK50637.1 PAS fold-containing protein [Reichenbachiella agariperforans]